MTSNARDAGHHLRTLYVILSVVWLTYNWTIEEFLLYLPIEEDDELFVKNTAV